MNGFEINKIVAAIILGVLLVFGVGKFTDWLFYVEKPAEPAYKMDSPVVKVASAKSSGSESVDIAKLLSLGTAEHGKKVFKKCSACHVVAKGGKNKIGPALYSIIDRAVGSVSDYKYSKALASYGKNWTFEELNGFLIKPATWIKGNKMGFAGIKNEKDRASVILYLNQNSDSPKQLP